MRGCAGVALGLLLILALILYGCARTRDRYRTCRMLGHGAVYCSFSALDDK